MNEFDLETPLMKMGEAGVWNIRNAVEGVQIFGGIGSGKTSGSGRMLALKYLAAGFGGLVLTVKPDEKELWQHYCAITGRTDDLIIVEPGGEYYFNFLDYESEQTAGGNSITENIVQVLKTVIRASEEKAGGKTDDAFWETALDMLIFHVIDLCKLAYGSVSVQRMYDIVQSLPKTDAPLAGACLEAMRNARQVVEKDEEEWLVNQSAERLVLLKNKDTYSQLCHEEVPTARLFKLLDEFFLESFCNLAERTRSVIEFSFAGFLFRLLRDPFYSLFCRNKYNFTPEDCGEGKIILLNLPVKIYHKIGRDSQVMFKYIWQRAMEKRKVNENSRPVFLWADEAQNFLHEHDAEYQATARSSKIATVYISQNLPNYLANMGGVKSEFKVKSFLGTLSTKIFHANADIETNRYASDLIGEDFFEDLSRTASMAGKFSTSRTQSVKVDRVLRPEDFGRLKTGGPANERIVEGYVHFQGQMLASGRNHIKINFNQNYTPSPQTVFS